MNSHHSRDLRVLSLSSSLSQTCSKLSRQKPVSVYTQHLCFPKQTFTIAGFHFPPLQNATLSLCAIFHVVYKIECCRDGAGIKHPLWGSLVVKAQAPLTSMVLELVWGFQRLITFVFKFVMAGLVINWL